MLKKIGLLAFTLVNIATAVSQNNWCGLHQQDISYLRQQFHRTKSVAQPSTGNVRKMTTYLPVRFFLVSNTDFTEAASESKALDALCLLNDKFESSELQFFLKEFSYLNNDNVNNDPQSFEGRTAIEAAMIYDAINIFIVENGGGFGVQGYYQPPMGPDGLDWIVILNQIATDEKLLPHEVGHFFGLLHTHNGWSCQIYDAAIHGNPVSVTHNCSVEIEFVNGSNCQTAGDMICDTPADYGIFVGECGLVIPIYDYNNDLLNPAHENIMGYHNGCVESFTSEQGTVMQNNLTLTERDYLPKDLIPNLTIITEQTNLLSPGNFSTINEYNAVPLEWTAVNGASHYLVEITGSSQPTLQLITTETNLVVTELSANSNYFWKVRPFNEYSTCAEFSNQNILKTGDIFVQNQEVKNTESWSVLPNPVSRQQTMSFLYKGHSSQFRMRLTNIQGQVVYEDQWLYTPQRQWPMEALAPGIYMLSVFTDNGWSNQKVVLSQ